MISTNKEFKTDKEKIKEALKLEKVPEPGFTITFFISDALLERVENKEDLVNFIANFKHTFLTETISAKSAINKWERSTVKRLVWDMGIR